MTFYKQFAPIYDQAVGNEFFKEWKACFEELSVRYDINYRSVIDVACGTGNALLYFYLKNKRVTGIDRSPDMLGEAKRKIGIRKIEIKKMDMCDLKLNDCADLITCNFNAVNDMKTMGQLRRVLRSFHRHLNQKGWVVFDFASVLDGRDEKDAEPQIMMSKKDRYLTILHEKWHEKTKEKSLIFFTFIRSKGKNYQLIKYEHKLKTFYLKDVRDQLKKAGFRRIYIHHWDEIGPPIVKYSGRYVVLAQK